MNVPVAAAGPSNSFTEQLRPFFPYLPSDLISARCLDQMLSVTQHLPGELAVGPFMFECGLDERPAADFSVAVVASRGDHAALCRPGSTVPPDDADWRRIRRFACAWANASSELSGAVKEAWLEFDVGLTGAAPRTTPSFFFGLDGPDPAAHPLPLPVRVAEEGLLLVRARPLPAATLATLTDCFALLPTGARILFVGAMLSRRSDAVRVVASGMGMADLVGYLKRIGLRGAERHLAPLDGIARLADDLWIAFDVDEGGIGPRIGLDCYCSGVARPGHRTWGRLLEFLVDRGICAPQKRDALLAAGNMSNRAVDAQVWPQSLRRLARVLGPAGFDRMKLYLHHIKVIAEPAGRVEAKAYLCGTYR